MKSILVIGAAMAVVFSFINASFAGAPAPAAPERVISVAADSVTVRLRPGAGFKVTNIDNDGKHQVQAPRNIMTYHVSQTTQISVDGLPSHLSDVVPGMKIVVDAGVNATEAARIVANTVPPAAPTPTPKPGVKKPSFRAGFRKITTEKVLAVNNGRITVAQDGAALARAYFIGPMTAITVNGHPAAASGIQPGMDVHIDAADQLTAATIQAEDDKHPSKD